MVYTYSNFQAFKTMSNSLPSQQTQESTSSTVTVVETDGQKIMMSYRRSVLTFLKRTSIKIEQSRAKSIRTQTVPENSPLEGVRILDLTRIVAGPYCTMILSDLGAEVIKIERPGTGDEARNWGPPFIGDTTESCYFMSLNRNKKSVCVDLKSSEGRDILYNLAEKCDVLVENYVPGKLDELKLGYDDLKVIAPHLIYCSITGYGPEGPYSHKPGYDVIAASVGGLLHITGPQGGEPVKVGVAVTDLATGLYAHGAIMAALYKRVKSGKGQKIDCNLLSTQVASLINIGSNYLNAGKEATRWGTAHESVVPYEAFPTKNGYFTIGIGSDMQFRDLCKRLGLAELGEDGEFLTNELRVINRNKLIGILRSTIVSKTNKEWAEIFDGSSFPCGPINSMAETFNDVHIKGIGLVKTITHSIAGEVKVVGPPVKYSDGGNFVRSAPPTLGQHTNEVLCDILGYNEDGIRALKAKNIVH